MVPQQDSEDSEDDDDAEGGVSFDLGRFCARRAGVYHTFSHWEVCSLLLSIYSD